MQRALVEVRRKLVALMRKEPPFRLLPGAEGPILDRWLTGRLSPEEFDVLDTLETLFGDEALAELFSQALIEAGVVRSRGRDEGRIRRASAVRPRVHLVLAGSSFEVEA